MALKTVPFNVAFTFSRPDPADYEDINGDTQTAGTDVPRFNYSEGVGEGLMLDASLSETAAINDTPNFNSSSGTWVINAVLDKSMPIPGSGFGEFMEGSGTLVFVYSNGVGKCWADGGVLFTVDPFSPAEPGFLSNGGLAKIQDLTYYPYAWTDEHAAAKSSGAFSTYFSPDLLFAGGTDGFWGDSTDSATLFQTTAGTTPAQPGDFCGLRLDKSKGLVVVFLANGENYYNIGFDAFSQTPNGFLAEKTTPGGNDYAISDNLTSFENGKTYFIDFDVIQIPGNTGVLLSSNTNNRSNQVFFSSLGKQRVVLTPDFSGDFSITFRSTLLGVLEIENVKAYELKGNHQRQPTTASKPTLQTVNGVQALVLDDDDDSMLIDVPTGGWSGTFVQGTSQGVIVGEIDVPAGPYQIPTDPNFAGPGSDIHTVIVNRTLAAHELDGLVEWVGQRCPVADFAGQTSAVAWFRGRTDLTMIDVSRWDLSLLIDWSGSFTNTNLSQQSYTDLVTAIESAGTSNGTLDITGGSATTTGAAQTAVDALRARGWTVTTPDGY